MTGLHSCTLWRADCPLLRLWVADRWWPRARGLLARPRLSPDEGLCLTPCSSVHGLGMAYGVDLVFLDAQCTVRRTSNLRPFGLAVCHGARMTLELATGTVHRLNLAAGQQLRMQYP
jgi:uncharacterized membrane protein (UPF0127 family)